MVRVAMILIQEDKLSPIIGSKSGGPAVNLQESNQPIAQFSIPFIEEDSTFEFTLTVTDNENAQDTGKVEVEVEAPPLPQSPDETGEICFDSIDNNSNGLVDERTSNLARLFFKPNEIDQVLSLWR
jgi:hypothetical protein